MRVRRSAGLVLVLSLAATACSALPVTAPSATVAHATGAPAPFVAHGSARQLWFTGAQPSTMAYLYNSTGVVAHEPTDAQGSLIFRNVTAGDGYVVQVGNGAAAVQTPPVRVLRNDERPPASFYTSKSIVDGYQYLTTRDGTQLAIMVRLPGPIDQGPYPTVVEYSGYSPADPNNPQPGTLLASTLGYATVGVNIRGTGCSGGAFQFFENLSNQDGYDVVESIAAQPWVLNNKVGMVGISYPAIAQLFTAQTRPPHLAAIAPLSVIDDTYAGTLYPGGILNNGFAIDWAAERQHDGEAAPASGQGWATTQIKNGDATCLANQALRGQMPDVLDLAQNKAQYYEPLHPLTRNKWQSISNLDSLAPRTFVNKINVPVFLAGAWDDEQTGPHFANMLDQFKSSPHAKFTLINGNHTESLTPEILVRWYEFLEFYVAHRVPQLPATFRAVGPSFFASIFGPTQQFPPDRFDPATTTYAAALAQYEAEPAVRVLFENGAGCPDVAIGAPCPTFETSFASWPPTNTQAAKWYLSEGGNLVPTAPPTASLDHYTYSGDGQARTFGGSTGELWKGLPALDWPAPSNNNGVSYVSAPLADTTVMAGTGRLDLQIGADVPDVDLEVTLSEVRADGTEYYVQTGWLRASHRKLDVARSNQFHAVPTHREADLQNLPADGSLTPLSVELMPFAHIFHAGSRVRIIVDVPGGTRPHWQFAIKQYDHPVDVRVGTGGVSASNIVLPVIPGVGASAPTALPPCPSLRGQPCRTYVPYTNG